MASSTGEPQVSAESVDGSGAATSSVGGYATATTDDGSPISWWPTVVEVPHSGCWSVVERLGDTTVQFVMSVT
ncbi:MAG: hypothetical protein ABS81_03260 [Pseudonocardia sp. SCN 72-86]|nr:MAG: hypothetical protein ABS81_03260 [Pseudonocardia sp. SCN 72-86]